ncbi:uncharacterized protein LOC107361810 isoform X2 [Tetranychus urticae]|uniref:uncharacterized protein LOC107361810 isoform X2 n=2 Tax=Tetranychus urticae TaxID=32264 RepID=UPI000D65BDB9|nr:uncharacterized protein LOC107361810 isoform X2 [Tetranychus urticae]
MLINELPDDCLLAIFDCVNNLDDLMNCFKVCVGWSQLIAKRTKKVKYILGIKRIDGTCLSTLFPNVKIAQFSYTLLRKVKLEDIVAFIRHQKSLKGLIHSLSEPIEKYCSKLEMVCLSRKSNILPNGSGIKQLLIWWSTLRDFARDAHNFPNLERLHLHIQDTYPDRYYHGPVLEKLKIVELDTFCPYDIIFYGFQFMDSCPNLQSAYIFTTNRCLFVDETIKHECLQDLAIEFNYNGGIDWNDLKRLSMKYPNLKHLALRKLNDLKDEHIEQLVHILPNLVLLDVRGCRGVTQKAADYVQDHCKRYGCSIKFYFNWDQINEIKSDWPQLYTKGQRICRGFDFMKHCFLKDFLDLPYLMIPIDY